MVVVAAVCACYNSLFPEGNSILLDSHSFHYELGKNHQAFFCTLRRVLAMWLLDVALGKTLLPGWFAMGSLPVLHGSAALAIKQLLPVMQTSGLPIAQALATSVVGNPLDPSKLALSAVLASMVMHLGTFYTFLTAASLDGKGIDNANPRETQRAVSGSLKGRLLAAHQNQVRLVLSSPPQANARWCCSNDVWLVHQHATVSV